MRVTYNCGCTLSHEEFGTPEYWPLPYYCPAHGVDRPMVSQSSDQVIPLRRSA